MWFNPMDADAFVRLVCPVLRTLSPDELASLVEEHWTPTQLSQLLSHESANVRRVACTVLGLVGDVRSTEGLLRALLDEDVQVGELAEHAIWSIWFRGGNAESQGFWKRGLESMEAEEPRRAVRLFRKAQQADPNFSEAYNQCAIAHYLLDEWEISLKQCRKTLAMTKHHFGAWAGMGHCHAQLGDLPGAARCYRTALAIHPGMEAIAVGLRRIEAAPTAFATTTF